MKKESFKERVFKGEIILIIILIILAQTATIFYFSIKFESIQADLASTKSELENQINKNNLEQQGKINELSKNLIDTEEILNQQTTELSQQISKIKASADSDFSGVIEDSIKGVVTIKTDVSQATGFLVTDNGYLITNAHVLEEATYADISTYDQKEHSSKLIGYNLTTDIALLKIEGNYNYLELGDSDNIKIGEKVIAIGNPLGLSFSVTQGIISSVNRMGPNEMPIYIQTDTALNPGNSGGPLIDTEGKVIGINNFKISGENIGFALESNYIKDTVNEIALRKLNRTII